MMSVVGEFVFFDKFSDIIFQIPLQGNQFYKKTIDLLLFIAHQNCEYFFRIDSYSHCIQKI